MDVKFRHIARGIIVDGNQILIARIKGAHSFLPGGGVEPGEGAKSALKRELQEELAINSCEMIRFLGVVEFAIKGKNYHEINHLFEVRSQDLSSSLIPKSLESHLEFYWVKPTFDKLKENNVLPYLVQEMIPQIINGGNPLWVSNM